MGAAGTVPTGVWLHLARVSNTLRAVSASLATGDTFTARYAAASLSELTGELETRLLAITPIAFAPTGKGVS